MRQYLVLCLVVVMAFFLNSCKEGFEPNAPFQEKYVLNCILNANDSVQIMTITRGYPPNADGSATPTGDLGVKNALVRVWVDDSVYFFHDTITERSDGSHGGGKVSFYVCKYYRSSPGKAHVVEAILPGGKKLKSSFDMPQPVSITFDPAVTVPTLQSDNFFLSWETTDRNVYFYPRLILSYKYQQDTSWILKTKKLPVDYVSRNGQTEYFYAIPSANHTIKVSKNALGSAITDIAQADQDKTHYKILGMNLEVYTLDKYLANYYANTAMQGGDFTIRLDEVDFTNITGGLGVFAGYVHQTLFINLNTDFIWSLGFNKEK
ncbi:MAG: DUF4249 family protein [Ignavibacteria bacterium]|nr:DUF4249 family protein [Ignavibacteria bacterium]